MICETNIQKWDTLSKIVFEYLEQSLDKDVPAIEYLKPWALEKELNLHIEDQPVNDEVFSEITKYLKYSLRTTHPQFNNQLNAGFNFEALMAEVVTYVSNTSMATYEIAPVATLIEKKLIELLNSKFGYTDGYGIMLTGGSNANMMAIHCARTKKFPNIRTEGASNLKTCIFVSDQAHYSFQKAVLLMGIGLDNLISVATDKNGKMETSDLEQKILTSLEQDKIPLMIASTAGTTVLGAFDPIEKIQSIAAQYNIWHHIDGAWGGAAIFSSTHKDLLSGSGSADSTTFDAHKLLGTGLITSFFLTKHSQILSEANSAGGEDYLFNSSEHEQFDTGRSSLQCGRRVDALKLWLTWKSKGHSGLENLVDEQFKKAQYFIELIEKNPRLNLIHGPEYLNVCFQVTPNDPRIDINKYNYDLRFKLVRSGKYLINYSQNRDGLIFFRMVFANNMTKKEHLDDLVDALLNLAID